MGKKFPWSFNFGSGPNCPAAPVVEKQSVQLLCATCWACETFVEVWWCGSVFYRSECQQLQLAWRPGGLNRVPWSTKELEDARRFSSVVHGSSRSHGFQAMAQAEAMDFRLDLGRSAERCSIVRLTGTFEKKDIFKVEGSTCKKKGRRSFFLNPCFGETWWLAVAALWLGSRTPSMTFPVAVHQIWLEKNICWPSIFWQRQLKAYVLRCSQI